MKKKSALSAVAASAIILGMMAPAAFADSSTSNPYTDINGNFAETSIINLTHLGYIHGYKNKTFRPNDIITRGQFLAYFMNVVKTATGVYPKATQQYFADIPPKNWDYNYVGSAWKAGWINPYWINVRLGGNFNENYHASWGDAASFFVAAMEKAGKIKSTGGKSPLVFSKSIGLFNGIPSTQNQIYLNRASAAVVLDNILQFVNGASGISGSTGGGTTGGSTGSTGTGTTGQGGASGTGSTGSNTSGNGSSSQTSSLPTGATVSLIGQTTMAPNSNEQLSVVVKDANGNPLSLTNPNITYSVNNPAGFISASGQLVVTTPGNYTVTATVDGITSTPLTVTVFGQANSLKFSQSQTQLVADGSAKATLTLQVVDQSGNPVNNFNGTVNFSDTNGQLVGANGNLTNSVQNIPVVNGTATVQVQATSVQGATDTITATGLQSSTGNPTNSNYSAVSTTTTVTQVPQQATSIKVTPSSSTVENNVPTADAFTVQVLDQGGQPMLTGVYEINLSVSGVGKLDAGTPTSTAYVGNGTTNSVVNGTAWSEQGVTGNIIISATPVSGENLQAGSATIQSIVVGSPAALSIQPTTNSTTSFKAGSSGSTFTIGTTDSNGHTVTDTNNPTYAATVWQGNTQVTSGVNAVISGDTVLVTGTKAGNYTLKVTSSDSLTPGSISFTIQPGTPTSVTFSSTSGSIDLPIGANSTTIQGSLVDAYGNAVTQSGVPVELTAAIRSGNDSPILAGAAANLYTVTTGADGTFSVNFTGSHTIGDAWTVTADKINGASVSSTPLSIKMVAAVPTVIHVSAEDTTSLPNNNPIYLHSTTAAQAGDTVTVTISATDSFGNGSPNQDVMQVMLPAGLTSPQGLTATSTPGVYTLTLPTTGTATFTATAAQAGPAAIQVSDLSVGSANLIGTADITIVPGPVVSAAVFSSTGIINSSSPLSVEANTPVQVWIKPVDAEGNPVNGGQQALTLTLGDGNKGGGFRTTPVGQNISTITIPVGTSAFPLYYVNGTSGDYVLTASVPAS